MTINLQTGGYTLPQALPGARSADVQPGYHHPSTDSSSAPPPAKPSYQATVTQPTSGTAQQTPDQKRYQQVAASVRSVSADLYPISDKDFTIFKDSNGEYITRYTSLRDGRVTYVPEVKMLQLFESQQRQDVRLQLKA